MHSTDCAQGMIIDTLLVYMYTVCNVDITVVVIQLSLGAGELEDG